MKVQVTYVRPNTARVQSGWKEIDPNRKESILYGYEEHGFKVNEVEDNSVIASHPEFGIRYIEFR